MKRNHDKLTINKTTIANLSQFDMDSLKGAGVSATDTLCLWDTCRTGVPACLTTQRCQSINA